MMGLKRAVRIVSDMLKNESSASVLVGQGQVEFDAVERVLHEARRVRNLGLEGAAYANRVRAVRRSERRLG